MLSFFTDSDTYIDFRRNFSEIRGLPRFIELWWNFEFFFQEVSEQKYFFPGRTASGAAHLKNRSHIAPNYRWYSMLYLRTRCRHLILLQKIQKKPSFHFSISVTVRENVFFIVFSCIFFHLLGLFEIAYPCREKMNWQNTKRRGHGSNWYS